MLHNQVIGPNMDRFTSQMKWLYLLEHLMKLEWSELTASCAQQMKISLNLKFMRISLVPSFSLFFIRIILNSLGVYSLSLVRCLNNLRIYRYWEPILQRMRSPILKLIRLGGEFHLARPINSLSYTRLETLRRPWMSRLRQWMMYECRLLTMFTVNMPAAFSKRSTWLNEFPLNDLKQWMACWSQLLAKICSKCLSISNFSSSTMSFTICFIHAKQVFTLPPRWHFTFSVRSKKQFFFSNLVHSYSHHLVRMRRMAGFLMVMCMLVISASLYWLTFQEILRPIAQEVQLLTRARYFYSSVRLASQSLAAGACPSIHSLDSIFSKQCWINSQNCSQKVGVLLLPTMDLFSLSSILFMSSFTNFMMRSLQLPLSRYSKPKLSLEQKKRSFYSAYMLSISFISLSSALLTTTVSVIGNLVSRQGATPSSMWLSIILIWSELRWRDQLSRMILQMMFSEQYILVWSQLILPCSKQWKAADSTSVHRLVIHCFRSTYSIYPPFRRGSQKTTFRSLGQISWALLSLFTSFSSFQKEPRSNLNCPPIASLSSVFLEARGVLGLLSISSVGSERSWSQGLVLFLFLTTILTMQFFMIAVDRVNNKIQVNFT